MVQDYNMIASAEALQEALEILFQIAEGNTTSNSRDREEGVKTSERRAERDGKSNGINERTRIQHDDDNRIEMERKEGESKQQKWTIGDAQCFVGQMHEDGMGIPCNEKEAARMYHLAVDNEHSVTQCMLGYFYDTGSLGLTKDLRKAFDLYHLAAAKNNYVAQYNLSLMYQVSFPSLSPLREILPLFVLIFPLSFLHSYNYPPPQTNLLPLFVLIFSAFFSSFFSYY